MKRIGRVWSRRAIQIGFLLAGAANCGELAGSAWAVAALLLTAIVPISRAWRSTRGTALRPSVIWAAIAWALAVASQVVAGYEPLSTGRPGSGQLVYLATLALLASGVSVLGARRPGSGAWAILNGLLGLILLVPWLEGVGLAGGRPAIDRLRLEMPWSLFVGLLGFAGVSNYLPTRHGLAASLAGVAIGLELLGLTQSGWPPEIRATIWTLSACVLGLSAWSSDGSKRAIVADNDPLGRLWAWHRDAWGAAWGLRMLDRFNRAADAAGWPIRLEWGGPIVDGQVPELDPTTRLEAARTLKALLRRFADPARVDEAAEPRAP